MVSHAASSKSTLAAEVSCIAKRHVSLMVVLMRCARIAVAAIVSRQIRISRIVFIGVKRYLTVYLCLREETVAPSTMHEKSHSGTSCRSLTSRWFVPSCSLTVMR